MAENRKSFSAIFSHFRLKCSSFKISQLFLSPHPDTLFSRLILRGGKSVICRDDLCLSLSLLLHPSPLQSVRITYYSMVCSTIKQPKLRSHFSPLVLSYSQFCTLLEGSGKFSYFPRFLWYCKNSKFKLYCPKYHKKPSGPTPLSTWKISSRVKFADIPELVSYMDEK